MSRCCLLIVVAATLFPARGWAAEDAAVRSRESFNAGWRFGRFGPMPDGSTTPEPGAERWSVTARASSEETSKGNGAEDAFDGDPQTRWCARGGSERMGPARPGGGPADRPGGPGLGVPGADVRQRDRDQRRWQAVDPFAPGPVRFLRVRVTQAPRGQVGEHPRDPPVRRPKGSRSGTRGSPAARPLRRPRSTDAGWRTLDVPHDWGIEGPFRDDLPGDTGKLPWKGIGWYRKHFNVPAGDQGKRIFIDFDGAMANARVWLNGHEVGGWPYGYQPFRLELTPHVKFGSENVLAVRLDTAHWGSRWYPGAGLYRNVWLVKTNPVHVGHWGVFVTTESLTDERGIARIDVTVENQGDGGRARTRSSRTSIEFGDGMARRRVASSDRRQPGIQGRGRRLRLGRGTAAGPHPRRWDLAAPNLYVARTTIRQGGGGSSTSTTSPSASGRSSSRLATASSSTAAASRCTARATITTSARWARP